MTLQACWLCDKASVPGGVQRPSLTLLALSCQEVGLEEGHSLLQHVILSALTPGDGVDVALNLAPAAGAGAGEASCNECSHAVMAISCARKLQ